MLAPLKVSVPVPDFVKETVPLPFWITPLKVVVFVPPLVSVTAPATVLVMVPAPAMEAIVSENPFRLNVAPLAMLREQLLPILSLAVLICTVPTFTLNAPELVFTPLSVRVPAPNLVIVPELEITLL